MPNNPMGIQYDEQGRPYLWLGNNRSYISPAAFGQGGGQYGVNGPDSASFLHTGSQWNQDTGQYENPIDWGNLMSLAIGGTIAAPFVAGAIGAGGAAGGAGGAEGAATTGGFAAIPTTGLGTTIPLAGATIPTAAATIPALGAVAPLAGATVPGATIPGAAAATVPAASAPAATGALLGSNSTVPAFTSTVAGVPSGTGITAATGGGSLASQLMNAYGKYAPQISSALGAIGGAIPDSANQTGTSTTSPTLDPQFGPLQNSLLQQIMARMSTGGPDLSGYEGTGIQNINKGYAGAQTNLDNSLAARGLSSSPVAGAGLAKLDTGRASDISSFQNTLPLLRDQFQQQNLGLAQQILGLGRGSTTTSTGQQQSGGGWGDSLKNIANILSIYYGARNGTPRAT